jgi:hypothetical protein
MPFRKLENLGLEYAIISFDANGKEVTNDPAGGTFSKTLLEKAKQDQPTDIFFFSHGWKGDFPAAVDQYDRWIGAMWKLEDDRKALGAKAKPLFIGLHWPSLPWGDEKLPSGASFAESVATPDIDAMFEPTVQHFGDTPEVRAALRVIFDAQKNDPGAVALPDEVEAAYHKLAEAIGFSGGKGPGGAPDEDGAPLDPQEAVRADRVASAAVPFGGPSGFFKGLLGGLRQLSFWQMKHRARTVGEQGMHQFIAALQQNCDAQIHLMGHSFGCIVVSSILGGPGGNTPLPKPVQSACLIQGALSLWSWGDKVQDTNTPGYFNKIIGSNSVAGPIITTQSVHDTAVGVFYPAAVGLVGEAAFDTELPKFGAVGAFGIQGTKVAKALKMLDEKGVYNFQPGVIYNIESSEYIKKMDGASGAHSDIDGPQVAHAIWQAATCAVTGQHV